jgi:SAM-dependent methyltransferase
MDPGQTARVRDVFDDWAKRGRAEGMESGHGPAVRAALARLPLRPGGRFLDIGCGNGYAVRWAAERTGPEGLATGLDIAPGMIERAQLLSTDVPGVRFLEASWPEHPLEPASIDAILSMEVFYYLSDLGAALRAAHDVLVPGGQFALLMDHYEENPASHGWPEQLGVGMHRLSREGWRAALEAAGFEVLSQTQVRQVRGEGDEETWKHTLGTLLTMARRPLLGGTDTPA